MLKKARFEWAPAHGGEQAQAIMVLAMLHGLIGAIRGLAQMGDTSAAELWEIVRTHGDEIVTDEGGVLETLRAFDA